MHLYYTSLTILIFLEILNATLSVSPVLNLYNTSPSENGGEYICGAVNDAGIGLSFSYINFIPEIVEQPQSVTVEPTDPVSLTCKADGFPYPEYHWQRKRTE